jgi:hypothetical protein
LIVTKQDKIPIAAKMTRIVEGGRGDYMEIDEKDLIRWNIAVPEDQKWRHTSKWENKVYYFWWETKDKVKLYEQQKTVNYADYKVGFWYVDPTLVEEVPDDEREPNVI